MDRAASPSPPYSRLVPAPFEANVAVGMPRSPASHSEYEHSLLARKGEWVG